jgi:Tfp pilus assembly protein FimT
MSAKRAARRMLSGAKRSEAGFTLVEISVVVFLVLALTGIAAPRIDVNRFRVDAAIQSAVSVLMSSRGEAIMRQHDVMVLFDTENRALRIVSDLNNNGEIDSGEPSRDVVLEDAVTFGQGGAAALFDQSSVVSLEKQVSNTPTLIFRRSGSASEEGVIYLTSMRGDAGTAFPGDARALFIERATGRVSCYSYRTLTWTEGC